MNEQKAPAAPEMAFLPKAYDPAQYSFIGFIFSLIPVFIMSFHNSRIFANGEKLRKTMKIFLIIFITLFVLSHAVTVWAVVYATKGILRNAMENPSSYISLMRGDSYGNLPSDVGFAKNVVQNSSTILFAAQLILLIFVLKFTNKNELTVYKEMKDAKKTATADMLVPVLVGIAVVAYQFMYSGDVVAAIAGMFL